MNDVSLWQNEIQFPVKNIWDSLNIFYISDIHLEFHIEGFETIKKRSLPPAIRKLIFLEKTRTEQKGDILTTLLLMEI